MIAHVSFFTDEAIAPAAATPAPAVAKKPFVAPSQNAPLDNADKRNLCIKARETWEHLGCPGDFNQWRHEEQHRACGKHSLCDASKRDFALIMAHWCDLKAETKLAFWWMERALTEGHRLALWKLKQICVEKNFSIEYAASIARRIWKRSLSNLTPRELWGLRFELQKRPAKVMQPVEDEPPI